jgi:hypothetical protein
MGTQRVFCGCLPKPFHPITALLGRSEQIDWQIDATLPELG